MGTRRLLDTYDAERRPLGAGAGLTRAQIGVMRGDAKSAALREVVADLLSTRDGTTYAVKKISGVTQRVDLSGDHPLVGRYVPDLWLTDGSVCPTTVTAAGSAARPHLDGTFAHAPRPGPGE
ncbi:hypothetical protein O1M63_10890 [Streptomyces mirabilis]|nr:hypothetical protein [Streptomyces mirabilis]